MPMLSIALQEGFDHDTVAIAVGEQDPVRLEDVTTRTQIGLATSFEADVESGPVRIDIAIPSRSIHESFTVEVTDDVYLGLSIAGTGIRHHVSTEPRGYL